MGWLGLVLGAGLEGFAWRFWLAEAGLAGLVCHLLASAAAFLSGWSRARSRVAPELARSWGQWTGLTALLMPGPGVLAPLVVPSVGQGTAVEELQEYTRPPQPPPPERRQTPEQQLAEAMTTELSLVQAVPGDVRTVRHLVESVPDLGDSHKVRRLLSLLTNPASDAYHMAAARIARLQEHFAVLIYQRREALAGEPTVASQVALAEVYVSYLRSGLLEGPLADFYYRLAVERFQAAANLEPEHPGWLLRMAELHRRNGRYGLALEVCSEVLNRFPGHMEARMRILEIYYYGARLGLDEATRQFLDVLQRLRGEIDPEQVRDPWLRGPAWWWFSSAGEVPHA